MVTYRLDAFVEGAVQRLGIDGVDVSGDREAIAVIALDHIHHNRARALIHHIHELVEVLGSPRRDRVGELRRRAALEMDVLDLDVTFSFCVVLKEEIDARVAAIGDLAPDGTIARELRYPLRAKRLFHQGIGQGGVDSHQMAVDADQLPAIGQFARRIGGPGYPDTGSRRIEPDHRARIGTVRGDDLSVGKLDVAQEPFIASDQGAGN